MIHLYHIWFIAHVAQDSTLIVKTKGFEQISIKKLLHVRHYAY